jgi:3-deoxy-D-manno-octulosonic-acid transferase
MYLAYSLLLTLGLIVLVPRFLYQAVAHGKYVTGFRERLGLINPGFNQTKPIIWLHCVSVGETQAARPLVEHLKTSHTRSSFHYHAYRSTTRQNVSKHRRRLSSISGLIGVGQSVRITTVKPSLIVVMERALLTLRNVRSRPFRCPRERTHFEVVPRLSSH